MMMFLNRKNIVIAKILGSTLLIRSYGKSFTNLDLEILRWCCHHDFRNGIIDSFLQSSSGGRLFLKDFHDEATNNTLTTP
jgi:hypothetical protein